MTQTLTMTLAKRITSTDLRTEGRTVERPVDEWIKFFEAGATVHRKEDGHVFIPAIFRAPMARVDACVEYMTALVLDLDHVNYGETLDVTGALKARKLTFWTYTTFSSQGPDNLSGRVVIPFANALAVRPEHWPEIWRHIVGQLGLGHTRIDQKCSNASRAYYLPCNNPVTYAHVAELWTPDVPQAFAERTRLTPPVIKGTASRAVLDAALADLERLGPAVEGQEGDAKTFRAAAIVTRDYALDTSDAMDLLLQWNRGNEPPWAPWQLEIKLENAQRYAKAAAGEARAVVEFAKGLRGKR